ncbi:hypothetical protein PC129_g11378 [Phytophthora cactorum]|uniref:Uncharacterized protein n=1 Tax=Phytophthora cactorum TaxID=29920 RepID=A0A8T1KLW2_9STRA|nr:hypothetical protein Pcac1_g1553 [Phytophthora cactorum]KAG2976894.1 hypothetical protein PC118_g13185 [Phytophthora cactorum]KAG3217806.1 hypothetical protein PC129_g11378 [Phytophthora cactorum]KAG4237040.1 hypothetical protein PC116_g14892 [Phytophthora cactorum]
MEGDNWKTGKPLVEEGFATEMMDAEIDNSTLRRELRYRNGMTTRWEHEGLVCDVRAQIMGRLAQARKQRAGIGGELIHQTAAELSYKTIVPRDAEGNVRKWAVYKAFAAEHDVRLFKDLVEITYVSPGKLLFQPRTMEYPELAFSQSISDLLRVSHGMEDPHHSFRIDQEDEHGKVVHGLSFTEQPVPMGNSMEEMEANIEALLGAPTGSVWATPHPALTHMRPLWAGKRRWTQTRKKYKAIIGRTRSHKAAQEQELTRVKGDLKHKELNYALKQLPWKNAHRLHGVTAYLKQNIVKMKAWRLRLWRGKEHKYRCAGTSCRHGSEGGQEHLVWECPDSQAVGAEWLDAWGMPLVRKGENGYQEQLTAIFSLTLTRVPSWLLEWGELHKINRGEVIYDVAAEVWAMGCAAIITALWRWKVAEVHPDRTSCEILVGAISSLKAALRDTVRQYMAWL